jgi:dihydrofolate reductase
MTKVRVMSFSISLDGYGAGPDQTIEQPLGSGGEELHEWLVDTRTFRSMYGDNPLYTGFIDSAKSADSGIDDGFAARGFMNVGAWIMGRNMFGPVRGPWPDESWKGWWGDNPPYHAPVFVLTHHEHGPIEMEGGTTFYFVTEGVESALEQAREAAGGRDVRIGGGANTIRQYLETGQIDEMHVAISPVLLGSGEHLLTGIDLPWLGYERTEHAATAKATHFVVARR